MKCAPAIAAGNVMITKASEMNPFGTLMAAELAIQAGIPPGVLNVLVGTVEAGEALSHHMRVRKISFTGSIGVGKLVQMGAAKSNLKKVTLELGGKSPVIVFEDADIDNAVQEISQGTLMFSGQGCIFGMRIYVHTSVAEKFVQGMKTAYENHGKTLTSPDINPFGGPVFHHRQFNTVLSFIDKGKKEAQLIAGGTRHGEKGCYIDPTIFYKPIKGADVMDKEIFGPVICIDTFETEDEVIRKANDTEYGLGSYIYTMNIDRAMRVAPKIQAGVVGVNTSNVHSKVAPFGGYKREFPNSIIVPIETKIDLTMNLITESGIGRENGIYVVKEYLQTKAVHIK